MDEREQEEKLDAAAGRTAGSGDLDEDPDEGESIAGDEQPVDQVEGPARRMSLDKRGEAAEDGRRIGGVRQPVLAQVAEPRVGHSLQEVLVLVRMKQRRLAVGDGEEKSGDEEEESSWHESSGRV